MTQIALIPETTAETVGGKARSEAGLCSVDRCTYKPVQIDRWGQIWCEAHKWRDHEDAGQRAL